MAAISKFLFDRDFDAEENMARTAPQSEMPRYTGAELEEARAAAHMEGFAAGQAAAENEIARRVADTADAIGVKLKHVLSESTKYHETRAREAVVAATEIVRRLLPVLGKREAMAEIEALIADCLGRLHDEPRLVIRVTDELLDPIRQRIDQLTGAAGFTGRVIFLADDTLKAGDVRIEWADGGADRDSTALWRDIENAIQRFTEDGSGAVDPDRK